MMGNKSFIYRFAGVEVREREFSLVKAGEVLPVEPKAFRVLLILLRNAPKLITKEELLNAVWGDAAVTDNSLARSVALLRRLLGDETRNPRYIETVATVGYRFVCKVEVAEDATAGLDKPEEPEDAANLQTPIAANLEKDSSGKLSRDSRQGLRWGGEGAHEQMERPRWRRMAPLAVAVIVLIAAIAGIGFWKKRTPHVGGTLNEQKVLAVLPFSNQTGANANSYLTEGVTESLIRQFSQIPGLRVISRAAADRVNKQNTANELGVGYLLTGALERSADGRLVLNVELSDAKNGTVLRSNQYIPDEADLRPIQADVVRDAVKGLGISVGTAEAAGAQRALTTSPAAYQDFLRGEAAARLRDNPANLHEAIRNFEEAVRLDPSFAFAYSSMAEGHLALGTFYEAPRDHMPLARQYAQRALALDPSLHQAHAILGLIDLVYDWNIPLAQRELEDADTRDNAIWQLGCTTHLLSINGRYRHAEEDLESMLEFDPHSAMLIAEFGCVKYYSGHYDDSIRYYQQALSFDPHSVLGYWGMGRSLASEGRYKEALEYLRRFKKLDGFEPTIITAEIGFTEAASGDRRAAMETLNQLQEESKHVYVDQYLMAVVYLGLKDRENAYALLDKACQAHSPFLIGIATDPMWSAWRSDARFEALWNRMTAVARS